MTRYPLIPAKAGTQMERLGRGLDELGALPAHVQPAIWIPAFAGTSGRMG